MHKTALLPLLVGCHVFADGEISLTCDDLADCGDADTGSPFDTTLDLSLSAGLALSMTDTESWLAGAFDPPDLTASVQKGGSGSTAGAIAWSADRNRLFLADGGAFYVFGPDKTDINKFEIPTLETVLDIQPIGQSVYLITTGWLIEQPSPKAELSTINDNSEGLGFVSMTADDTTLYLISDDGSDGSDLYTFDTESDFVDLSAENFDSDAARVDGDIFQGADGALMSCSTAGSIYSLTEMISTGTTSEDVASVSTSLDDVLTCGFDTDSGRYLVISASMGLFIIAPGEDDTLVDLTIDGQTLEGAHIY